MTTTTTAILWSLLAVYALGVVVFLIGFRERVLGGWFQALVTALLWPALLVMLWVDCRKDTLS